MKFLSSVLLTSSAILGGRIDSSGSKVSLPAGCEANCTFSQNWACPSGQKKGAKGWAGIKNNDYKVCCDQGAWQTTCNANRPAAFQVEGAGQCLKCDEEKKLCTTAGPTEKCSKFKLSKSKGIYKIKDDGLKGQCLDWHKKGFGLWNCQKKNKNQKDFKKDGNKICFSSRKKKNDGKDLCLTDLVSVKPNVTDCEFDCSWTNNWACPGGPEGAKGFAAVLNTTGYNYCCKKGGNKKCTKKTCLKCDKAKTLCTQSDGKDCAEFNIDDNGQFRWTKDRNQCLDKFEKTKFGLWDCIKDHGNQMSKVVDRKRCFTTRGSTLCINW